MEEKPFSPTTELTCDGAFFVCTVPVPPTKKARKLNVIGHIENKPSRKWYHDSNEQHTLPFSLLMKDERQIFLQVWYYFRLKRIYITRSVSWFFPNQLSDLDIEETPKE